MNAKPRRAYAASTEAPSDRTRNEIHKLLTKNGATHFAYLSGPGEDTIGFQIENRRVKLVLPLPSRTDERVIYTDSKRWIRSPIEQDKAYEQLIRSRWRALHLVIKAKIEAVALGISTFEDEFLAGTILPNQQTVAEYLKPQIERVYVTGKMPSGLAALNAGEPEAAFEGQFVESET